MTNEHKSHICGIKVWKTALLACAFALMSCTSQTTSGTTTFYTVSFETNGGSTIESIQVEAGRRITATIDVPTKDGNYEFDGWFKDNETFTNPWNFEIDIVTADLTLYAKWLDSQPFPTNIQMVSEPFSSNVTWRQTGITAETVFSVYLTLGELKTRTETQLDEDGAEVQVQVQYYDYDSGIPFFVAGTHQSSSGYNITWTPTIIPAGGYYKVLIITDGEQPGVSVENMVFKGAGTELNPYLIYSSTDLAAISQVDNVGTGKKYKVAASFTHDVSYVDIQDKTFLGEVDGNDTAIVVNGNCGVFYEIAQGAMLKNMLVTGVISTSSVPNVGAIAHINRGVITESVSRAAITTSTGIVGDLSSLATAGTGGFVGTNETTGIIEKSQFIGTSSADGVIKALIGSGGIAGVNKGIIRDVENRGTLGAYNAVESGKTLSNYSYMGGIAGVNYGTITRAATLSTGKLLAQRYVGSQPTDSSNNRVIGGIVGYNAANATLSESFFAGIRVHGDQYVGGIAGINAGTVINTYTAGRYFTSTNGRSYIGGRRNVGGIVGLLEGSGTVTNSFNAANVYGFEEAPYATASSSTNCVYIRINHDLRATGTQTYGNSYTDLPLAPLGTGNTMENNNALVNGDGIHYYLPDTYAAQLGSAFATSNGATVLAWELT